MTDPRDLSGVWYGHWTTEHPLILPNSFIALLVEAATDVRGTITEPDLHGGDVLRAFVSGNRSGAEVRFQKQYDPAGRLAHAVGYAGRIDAAGTLVTGTWQFERHSGAFTMRREQFSADELADEQDTDVPRAAVPVV